jgi:hypothetical protein
MQITDQRVKDVMNAAQWIDQVIKTFEKIVANTHDVQIYEFSWLRSHR